MNLEKLINEKKATVVDVRTNGEFNSGHVAGSLNIPLQELEVRMDEIKKLHTPLILCCASGNRSGIATQVLSQKGLECYNGGSWTDVNYYITQTH